MDCDYTLRSDFLKGGHRFFRSLWAEAQDLNLKDRQTRRSDTGIDPTELSLYTVGPLN